MKIVAFTTKNALPAKVRSQKAGGRWQQGAGGSVPEEAQWSWRTAFGWGQEEDSFVVTIPSHYRGNSRDEVIRVRIVDQGKFIEGGERKDNASLNAGVYKNGTASALQRGACPGQPSSCADWRKSETKKEELEPPHL